MKARSLWSLLIVITTCMSLYGQQTVPVDSFLRNLGQNFAIPDIPASNALGIESGNLLRASSPKDFTMVANQFYNGTNIVIPKSIAIEIAPITIMKYNTLTIQAYQRRPVLYNSRISLGTYRDSSSISRAAIGFRTTIINKGDIKSDANFTKLLADLRMVNTSRSEYYDSELIRLNKTELDFATDTLLQKQLENSFNKLVDNTDTLKIYTSKYTGGNCWNYEKLDIAISIVGSSDDSLISNIKYNSLWLWSTYARPIGENSQFMIGLNADFNKLDSIRFMNVCIPARFYVGSNTFKGFLEGIYQYKQRVETSNCTLNLGCEYNVYEGIWVDFSAGLAKDITNNTSHFTSNFKFIYGLPGKLK